MCYDLKPIADLEATVYKVVAKKPKGHRLYSVAMGFAYPTLRGNIPKIKIQHRVGEHFNKNILIAKNIYSAYNKHMVGRTAGFINSMDAERLAHEIRSNTSRDQYLIFVKKAILTKELMSGKYGGQVIAGKHIEWV